MRTNFLSAVLVVITLSGAGPAVGENAATEVRARETMSLEESTTALEVPKRSETRLARVMGWIRERAPECPPEVMVSIAQQFLDELQENHPEQLERLLAPDFPVREIESTLSRQIAGQLKGPKWADLRQQFAKRQVEAILAREGIALSAADDLMAKISDASHVQYRRLLEGRMEDEDLSRLLKKVRPGGAAPAAAVPEQAAPLSSAEIISEFTRHNQEGAALQQLKAFIIEAKLKTASGEEQRLLLFKMRPDRFRLAVFVDGAPRLIVAGDGRIFWQQASGQEPQPVPADKMGTRRYLGDFVEPLFAGEGFTYERLADGASEGRKFYRIAVRRSDGSIYVTQIDMDSFRQIGREDGDGVYTRYSDFRKVAGMTIAFHEEANDREGRKGVLKLVRMTPNPGLIDDLFEPLAQGGQSYFFFERLLAGPPSAGGNSKPSPR